MNRYYYDLHIHSCLSPCADNDSTPVNIAGMAALNGLQIVALTDHNSVRNCPAFCEAARCYGLIPIPGMELTTAEDIHVICLFPDLEHAEAFGAVIEEKRIRVKNRPAIFGDQLIMNTDDEIIGREEDLLINATSVTLRGAWKLAQECGGICYPAHIDRPSNGIVETLGTFPDDPPYTAYELKNGAEREAMAAKYPQLCPLRSVTSSDAHDLGAISEAENFLLLDDEPYSSRLVIRNLFRYLRGEDA